MLKKSIIFTLLIISKISSSANYGLSIDNRPETLKDIIEEKFHNLSAKTGSDWTANGDTSYDFFNVDEYKLLKSIILSHEDQSDFYVLDIGAGDFSLAKHLAKKLEKDVELPNGREIKVHIISLRGEQNEEKEIEHIGRSILYNFGAFKIEDPINSFLQKEYTIDHKFDLIFSSMCFRHLVDPMGTFSEFYKLLKEDTGLFFFEGFETRLEGTDLLDSIQLFGIFSTMGAKILMQPYRKYHGYYQYALIKPQDARSSLPLAYTETMFDAFPNNAAKKGIMFKPTSPIIQYTEKDQDCLDAYIQYGDYEVFNRLQELKPWATFGNMCLGDGLTHQPLSAIETEPQPNESLFKFCSIL